MSNKCSLLPIPKYPPLAILVNDILVLTFHSEKYSTFSPIEKKHNDSKFSQGTFFLLWVRHMGNSHANISPSLLPRIHHWN